MYQYRQLSKWEFCLSFLFHCCLCSTIIAAPLENRWPTTPDTTTTTDIEERSPPSKELSWDELQKVLEPLKYFHEPGRDDILGHYDVRYFHGVVAEEERTETLRHMTRAYLQTFRDLNLDTWIAHGTLLGWWWNSKILPWDWDVDTQVPETTLLYMSEHLNRTEYPYNSIDDGFERTYLLDVNPYAFRRKANETDYLSVANIIDARWIDTKNGLYIDITVLSELHPYQQPGLWSDKNKHKYWIKDLYPMRESVFEGVPSLIPYAYNKILTEEYSDNALITEEFHEHRWDHDSTTWVKIPEKKEDEASDNEERHFE